MRPHVWEDLGNAGPSHGGEHRWACRGCGAETTSCDKPWTEDGQDRVAITAIECGGGPALERILADCEQELVRRLMTS